MKHWKAIAAAVILPLVLVACLFVPGKFTSALTIKADRSFTYSYKGEVVAVDLAGQMKKAFSGFASLADNSSDGGNSAMTSTEPTTEEKATQDAKYRDVAAKLAKEAGYRTVEYRGDGKFYVDYEISGVLTHNFVFPYNQDTGLIFPFVAIELRGKDIVRVKAPGFGKQTDTDGAGDMSSMGAGEEAMANLDGTFTLTTDAEILSQNQEDGPKTVGTSKTVTWKVSPTSEDAPMASLRVKGI